MSDWTGRFLNRTATTGRSTDGFENESSGLTHRYEGAKTMKRKTPAKKSGSGDHLTLDSRSGMSDPLTLYKDITNRDQKGVGLSRFYSSGA
jgi:hypothetical protein